MSALAAALEQRRGKIIQRWTETLRRQWTKGGVTQAEIVEHLPDFLQQLEALLREASAGDERSSQGGIQAVARAHGGQRYRLGFSLDELMSEYGVLRELLLDVIEEEGLQVTWREIRQLTRFVTTAIAEAVKEHTREREHAQREAQEAEGAERRRRETERERLLQETDRLRAVAEEERSLLGGFIQQVPAIVAILRGPELVLERLNDETCRVWGRAREQMEGRPMMQALPELEKQGFDALMRGVLATGEPYVGTEVPAPVRQPDGTVMTRYLSFRYAPWRNHEGRIERLLIVGMDVTATVLARRAVQSERERAERSRTALLEALNAQPLVAINYQRGPHHVFEMANPLYQELMGRDMVGQPLLEAFPEVVSQGVKALLDRVRETGDPWVGREQTFQVRAKDGTLHERLFDFVLQPVRGADGQVEGTLNLLFEVTEQVRLRREAERLAREERERRDFEQHLIGIVSHDLRSPLSAIRHGLQLLLRRELDAHTLQSLMRIQSSAERAVRMVRDLLDFTQARLGGGLKIQRAPMDVHALVRGVVEEHQVTHPERELRLEQRGGGQGAWDADRVAQMLGNLLGNALKYSPTGSPVTVRSLGEAGDLRLEVHNGGDPIPAQAMARLFQPLQRAVEGTDSAGRSVGLGLYIVDQIVRAHGGDVQVSSTEREGTTFSVRLPRLG